MNTGDDEDEVTKIGIPYQFVCTTEDKTEDEVRRWTTSTVAADSRWGLPPRVRVQQKFDRRTPYMHRTQFMVFGYDY
jgi:hypothetical protein